MLGCYWYLLWPDYLLGELAELSIDSPAILCVAFEPRVSERFFIVATFAGYLTTDASSYAPTGT